MKNINLFLVAGTFCMLLITSCKKDEPKDPIIPNEEEVITTLNFSLTPTAVGVNEKLSVVITSSSLGMIGSFGSSFLQEVINNMQNVPATRNKLIFFIILVLN